MDKEFSKEEMDKFGPIMEPKPSVISQADDWEQAWLPGQKREKGGMIYHSKKLNKVRHTTFSEYYGDGIVD